MAGARRAPTLKFWDAPGTGLGRPWYWTGTTRTSYDTVTAKFAEIVKGDVRRVSLPRTPVNMEPLHTGVIPLELLRRGSRRDVRQNRRRCSSRPCAYRRVPYCPSLSTRHLSPRQAELSPCPVAPLHLRGPP